MTVILPVPVDPADTLAVLRAAEAWLSEPAHWTRGRYWCSASGLTTRRRECVAATCALGAIGLAAADTPWEAFEALGRSVGSPSAVNDGPDGYNRIMAGLRKTIEAEEKARADA